MNKKILCVLMSLVLLIGCFSITTFATEERDVQVVVDCDSTFGGFVLNMAQKTEGRASLALKLKDEAFSFANSTMLSPTKNIDDCNTLAIDFYLTDPRKIANSFSELVVELTSSGTYDNGEIAFYVHSELKGMASEMEPGWNTLYIDINNAGYTSKPDSVDLTKINYVRIFGRSVGGDGLSSETMLIDNIRMCNTDGPSFDDLEHLMQFRGDNSDVDVEVSGIVKPDVSKRHEEVSINQGEKLEESERVVVPEDTLKQPSISVNPEDQPVRPSTPTEPSQGNGDVGDTDVDPQTPATTTNMTLVLVVVICAAVIVIAAAVLALVLVLNKTKK